jgi:hypothetical protein
VPTFCRHNRFIERCPICSKTLPGSEPSARPARRSPGAAGSRPRGAERAGRRPRADGLRVRHEGRAVEDGYASPLVPGLRASADARRLAAEIAFSSARLAALAIDPPGTYGLAVEEAAAGDFERATWVAFLLAYLSPTEGEQPFAGIDAALAAAPGPGADAGGLGELLDGLPRGPRGSHARGAARTLNAYAQFLSRGGSQEAAFTGDAGWNAERRFARLFERLALPGLTRAARYELLVTLGRLGVYDLRADSLHLGGGRASGEDEASLAAKRVFGIGDPLLLDRRAAALAQAAGVPLEALDLALYNWAAGERATLAFRPADEPVAEGALAALGL